MPGTQANSQTCWGSVAAVHSSGRQQDVLFDCSASVDGHVSTSLSHATHAFASHGNSRSQDSCLVLGATQPGNIVQVGHTHTDTHTHTTGPAQAAGHQHLSSSSSITHSITVSANATWIPAGMVPAGMVPAGMMAHGGAPTRTTHGAGPQMKGRQARGDGWNGG